VINGAERVIVSQLHRSPGVGVRKESSTPTASGCSRRASSRSAARGRVHDRHPRRDLRPPSTRRKSSGDGALRAFGYGTNADILERSTRRRTSTSPVSSKAGPEARSAGDAARGRPCPTPRTEGPSRSGRSRRADAREVQHLPPGRDQQR